MTTPVTPPSPSAPTAAAAPAGTGESTPRVRTTVAAAGVPNRLPMGGEVAAAPVPARAAGRRNLLVEEPEVTEGVPKEPMAVDAVVTAAPTATGAAPILLAQAETAAGATTSAASGGAGSATAAGGTAAAAPVSGSVIGSTGWLVALGAVGVTAVAASSNSGSSAAAPAAPAPVTGTAIDGYLSGATVFIDVNGNGQLDAGEPSTTTDAQGNFTLPGGTSGPLVAFGGTDISTGLEFKGILKAPAGATVVTPLTTLVADMATRTGSVANAEAAVFKALGLGALDSGINLLTFDPILATQSTDAARRSAGLDLQKGAVLVANMVTDLVTRIQSSTGAGDAQRDDIARDIFSTLADRLGDNALTTTGIGTLATTLIDQVAARPTVGGVNITAVRAEIEADRTAFSSTHTAFQQAIKDVTTLNAVGQTQRESQSAVRLINASVDGLGDVITLYFDRPLDMDNLPSVSQFTVTNGSAATISSVQVASNQVQLKLASALDAAQPVRVSFADASASNDTATVQDRAGVDARSFSNVTVANRLSLTPTQTEAFAQASSISLVNGAEISAFDPASDRLFVTSPLGLQVLSVGADLSLTLLGTVSLGSNDVNSVAVKNGVVAVAVAAVDKTQPGTVFFLKADATVGAGMVQGSVTVGALPDMLTFSADGRTVLVANEAEQATAATAPAMATVANPEGSVSIIDLSGGAAAATVRTASFAAFNSQRDALKAAGVRLMAGETGFETVTVAQDLEPEYIAISADGRTAFVTLQENNAIAVLDIARATFTGIVPLGLKSFLGLPFDGSDRDGASSGVATNLQTDQPVFGQYMPDAITSFAGADGRTWYLIANEGDDRDDFITPDETARVSVLNLDATRFPNGTALKTNAEIGRLTVSNAPGNNGDTDRDGDIDRILAYGARSFSILNSDGAIVFDSGSHIEQFVATGGAFTGAAGSGLFDDTRSDNKGPEPEGVTVGRVGDRTLAFVGLERGGGGVMVYDVTNPLSVSFVQYLRRPGDESPEGLAFVTPAESPNGKSLLVVTNEVSKTVSVYQNQTYTLQLLHFADGEAGLLASTTAPRMAAMIDRFEDAYANSITLAGGDNFIPGPFLAAGTDSKVIPALNAVSGSTIAATATVPIAAADIVLHNLMGVEASTIGNHEFDLGSRVFRDSFIPASGYVGAQFPYLSANLDFSGDADLASRYTNTTAAPGLELASANKGRIVPSAVLQEGGQSIGLVGVTTQLLEAISSPSGTEVRGFPTGPGANGEVDNMDLLATQLQPVIDDLIAQGVNKIILMSHLQVLANERLLATKLSGVDIILGAGSNTRLGDANDTAVAFPGHAANFADTYPVVIRDKTGGNTLLVNTDNEYTYLGRLVVDFDNAGNIRVDSLATNAGINGAYAATDANVAAAWSVDSAQLATTAFAAGTKGGQVKTLVDAVQSVIGAKDGNVLGYSTVYLEGERAKVRSEETNLGNLTADANRNAAIQALGSEAANTFVVSLKNGGGIRAQIGAISPPKADGTVDYLPPDGGVSQLDIENSLRFNNQLMVFDTTPEGLKAILEHGVAAGTLQGRFPQIGGVAFSWDPDFAAGARVNDIALVADGKRVNLYNDGAKVASAPAKITVVTLNFMANGGDSYPMKANGDNFRYLIENANGTFSLSTAVDEALDYTAATTVQTYTTGPTVDASKAFAADTYLLGTSGRAAFREVISAGETAGNGYMFNGIPDGIGVLDNGDGTLRVLVNHELGATAGDVRAHGSKGAYVSELVLDKATLSVVRGQDFLQSATNLYMASPDGASWSNGTTTAFSRFCSGDLAADTAFRSGTTGYNGRIYLAGEESGAEGRAFAHIVTGAEAGRVYELPSLGNLSFENVVANPVAQGKTVVAALDDTSTNGQVYLYVGNKSATGNAVEQAGLAGGKLFGVKVGSGATAATETGAVPAETGLGLVNGAASFSLVDLGDVKGKTGATLNTESIAAGATNFLRPEDGAWSADGKTFYFVTTATTTTASRLWALEFTSAATPESGGTIRVLLDGSEGQIMMDNLTVAADGSILIQEDPGANDRLAKIWKYTPSNDTLVEIAQHDPALFTGAGRLTNDEESSGIVEVTSFFTGVAGYDTAKYNYFLVADQIHKSVTSPTSVVEMGELTVMATPKAADNPESAFPVKPVYLVPTEGRSAIKPIISAGETAGNGYMFNGIPDGIGVLDNGDGTLRVLVNHELGATAGDVRAHGSKGAYVSELVLDKATLSVVRGQDFLQSATNLYMASPDGASWSNGTTTAFSRFCSGDLAADTAFRSGTTGYNGRIYLAGEESGAEGRAFAHIVTGAEAGRVYELPSLGNLSFENVVANPVAQGKTVVAALDDTSTNGQVYLYVGNKSATGNAVEQAGLAGGKLFGVKVGSGATAATETGAVPAETGLGLVNGAASFSLVDLGDVKGKTGATLNTESIAAGATNFLRPEDGAWSADGKTFYFVTTATTTTASRLWALEFTSAATPESGGTIRVLLDGSEGQIMMDNLTVAADGSILIQEDPGANDRLAKIWKYTPSNDTLVEIAQHDPALFTGAGRLTNDEESSGIVEVTSFFTGVAGYDTAKYNYFLVADQIHKGVASPTSVVEMGQLSLVATSKNELLGEQDALASYLKAFHATPATAFTQADTTLAQDTRIQNLNFRNEEVLTTQLGVGDLRFVAANADATDAFSFILLKSVVSGTQVGFTDRNFVEASGMPASGEAAYLWTADRAYAAGTIVTIQPDVASGANPLADKGTVRGAGGGLSGSGETIYAFQGGIAGLLDGGAGAITIDRLLASLNVGGGVAGDVPTSIAAASQSFNADNAKYTGSTSATDITALVASIGNPANWTLNDTTAFALSNGSLF